MRAQILALQEPCRSHEARTGKWRSVEGNHPCLKLVLTVSASHAASAPRLAIGALVEGFLIFALLVESNFLGWTRCIRNGQTIGGYIDTLNTPMSPPDFAVVFVLSLPVCSRNT